MFKGVVLVLLLCLGIVVSDYRVQKRLQWKTFVVCPGGEIAFGQRCNEKVEKKANPRFLSYRGLERYIGRLL